MPREEKLVGGSASECAGRRLLPHTRHRQDPQSQVDLGGRLAVLDLGVSALRRADLSGQLGLRPVAPAALGADHHADDLWTADAQRCPRLRNAERTSRGDCRAMIKFIRFINCRSVACALRYFLAWQEEH